jgi:hypothetical protein
VTWGSGGSDAFAITQQIVALDPVESLEASQMLEMVMAGLSSWFLLVKDWCEVLTRQDLDSIAPRRRVNVEGSEWACWHGDRSIDVPLRISLDFDYGEPLTAQRWGRVLELAGTATQASVEHLLLRDARAADARGQYRRVVVDAATALEIALHRILLAEHRSSPTPLGSELLTMAERWTLGTLIRVVGSIGALPLGVTPDLATLRNEVVHRKAKEPSKSDANQILSAANKAVEYATPVPTDL